MLCENLLCRLSGCKIDKYVHCWAASVHKFWMLRLKIQVGSTAFEVRPWHCRIWEWPCELDSLHLACYQPSLPAKHWVWHKYQTSVLLCATDRILLMLDLNPQLDKNVSVLYFNHFNCVSHWSSKHLWFYKDCECIENGPPLWLNAAQTNPLCVTCHHTSASETQNHKLYEPGRGFWRITTTDLSCSYTLLWTSF